MIEVVDAAFVWDGKVLLCLEKVRGCPNRLYWLPPGGKVENGENREAALRRELEEELGLTADILKAAGVGLRPYCLSQAIWGGQGRLFHHFLAECEVPPPIQLRIGQKKFGWFSSAPAAGLVSEVTEALLVRLRLDGYLRR